MKIPQCYPARTRILLAILLATMAAFALPKESNAHAYLIRSEPADGAIITNDTPEEVRLWFDEPISGQFSSAQLFNSSGQQVALADIQVDSADPTLLIISLPGTLSPDSYSLLYKALSETDGHFSQGLLVFGIGAEADLSAASVANDVANELSPVEVALRWINFALLAGIVGGIAMAQLVLTRNRIQSSPTYETFLFLNSARQRLIRLAEIFVFIAILAGLGLLWWQTKVLLTSLPGDAFTGQVTTRIIFETRWGNLWLLRQIVLIILAPTLFILFRQEKKSQSHQPGTFRLVTFYWLLMTTLALVLVAAQSLTSHASGLAQYTALAVSADILHLLAASLWVGGLAALVITLAPPMLKHRAAIPSIIQSGWKPFSGVALISVITLIATGLYSTGRQVASLDTLLTTFYGQALLTKIAMMLLVGAFGMLNSILLHPRLALPIAWLLRRPTVWKPLSLRKLPYLVMTEASVGILVLLITGVVTASPAPRSNEYTVNPQEVPGALSQTVDDLVITLSAKPNRPGQNVFNVFTRSTRRPPPAEIGRVILRFNYLDQDIGRKSATAEQIAPDRYLLGGDFLNLSGNWEIEVVVRRLGLEDSVARFAWTVIPPGQIQPVIVSQEPIEPITTLLAAIFLLLVSTGVAGWFVRTRTIGYSPVMENVSPVFQKIKLPTSLTAYLRDKTVSRGRKPTC